MRNVSMSDLRCTDELAGIACFGPSVCLYPQGNRNECNYKKSEELGLVVGKENVEATANYRAAMNVAMIGGGVDG